MKNEKRNSYLKRKRRVRKKISGTQERPRISVFRSAKHIYAQAIDDTSGKTLASFSSLNNGIKDEIAHKKKTELSFVIGQFLGLKLKDLGLNTVVFDRNGFRYKGRIAAVADGIRDSGVLF